MTRPVQVAGSRFEWRLLEAGPRSYQLIADGQTVAILRFEKRCGTLATAEWLPHPGFRWTCKRIGFWSPRVTVREAGWETELAVFTPSWSGGGELAFSSRHTFQLKSINGWGRGWAFETEEGNEVARLHAPHGLVRSHVEMTLGPAAAATFETPLLLLLLCYLRVLMQDDAATAGMLAALHA